MNRRWMIFLFAVTAGIIAVACGSDEGLGSGRVGSAAPTTASSVAVDASTQVNTFDPGTPCPTANTARANVVATPGISIDQSRSYQAIIKTNKGDIKLDLFDDEVPVTVNNFVHLARCGYYDGIPFHRVIANFMVQGGGGSPGYSIPDEFHPDLLHSGPGTLSMANAGFGTGGSQFFITHNATPHLDGYEADGSPKPCEIPVVSCHPVFGRVIEGQDVVDKLQVTGGGATPDTIKTIEIIES